MFSLVTDSLKSIGRATIGSTATDYLSEKISDATTPLLSEIKDLSHFAMQPSTRICVYNAMAHSFNRGSLFGPMGVALLGNAILTNSFESALTAIILSAIALAQNTDHFYQISPIFIPDLNVMIHLTPRQISLLTDEEFNILRALATQELNQLQPAPAQRTLRPPVERAGPSRG